MRTQYGMYALFDSELQCFIPDTLMIALNDRQAVSAWVQGMDKANIDKVREILPHRRFYRLGFMEIDKIPEGAMELTSEVNANFEKVCCGGFQKGVVDHVPDKV